jgi:hypothetical protein
MPPGAGSELSGRRGTVLGPKESPPTSTPERLRGVRTAASLLSTPCRRVPLRGKRRCATGAAGRGVTASGRSEPSGRLGAGLLAEANRAETVLEGTVQFSLSVGWWGRPSKLPACRYVIHCSNSLSGHRGVNLPRLLSSGSRRAVAERTERREPTAWPTHRPPARNDSLAG